MKKAFDRNVSRSRPRLRGIQAFTAPPETEVEVREEEAPEPSNAKAGAGSRSRARGGAEAAASEERSEQSLGDEIRNRAVRSREARKPAAQALRDALVQPGSPNAPSARQATPPKTESKSQVRDEPSARIPAPEPQTQEDEPVAFAEEQPRAGFEPPAEEQEIRAEPVPQAPPAQENPEALDPETRRTRLKARLEAVRQSPRIRPLPETSAEAGAMAVERISTLREELGRTRALNLTLTQELEAARRVAERATEDARSRMEEARRLASELEERGKLLGELEKELSALEGERDESLLALQEARQSLEGADRNRSELEETVREKERALEESLSEEERLAEELGVAKEEAGRLQAALDALESERDGLARQVGELSSEVGELLEARKALEAVHQALTQAR